MTACVTANSISWIAKGPILRGLFRRENRENGLIPQSCSKVSFSTNIEPTYSLLRVPTQGTACKKEKRKKEKHTNQSPSMQSSCMGEKNTEENKSNNKCFSKFPEKTQSSFKNKSYMYNLGGRHMTSLHISFISLSDSKVGRSSFFCGPQTLPQPQRGQGYRPGPPHSTHTNIFLLHNPLSLQINFQKKRLTEPHFHLSTVSKFGFKPEYLKIFSYLFPAPSKVA